MQSATTGSAADISGENLKSRNPVLGISSVEFHVSYTLMLIYVDIVKGKLSIR